MQPLSTRKNHGHLMNAPQYKKSRSIRARRALAQPRFLLGAAAFALAGATWAAFAAPSTPKKAPVAMPHTSAGQSKSKPLSLDDLPGLVAQYGESKRLKALATSGRTTRAVGTGQSGFNLVETDLTPGSPSDERQPVVSPGGDFIAFVSNGADTNNDGQIDALNAQGKFHVWLMNRNGTGQRQLTGLNAMLNGTTGDINRNQARPSWSPDGNQLVYIDEDATNPTTVTQLWVINPLVDTDGDASNGTQVSLPEQRTFFAGRKESPAWSPSGLSIAFVTNFDARTTTAPSAANLNSRDIFTISPDGSLISLTRVTGDANDATGNTTDDTNPAWGIVNRNLLFFSSNRDKNGLLTGAAAAGRRIWRIFPNGTGANPVTDPTQRSNGQVDDQDDFPAPSATGSFQGGGGTTKTVGEQLAFQTNTFLDDTDQADGARGRDLNIWSLPLDTSGFTPPSVQAEPRLFVSAFDSGKVLAFNTKTQQLSDAFPQLPVTSSSLNSPESLAMGRGINSDGNLTNFVYIADRGSNRIDRFDESNGAPAGGLVTNPNSAIFDATAPGYAFTPALVPSVSGVTTDNNFVYASSGQGTTALYRFSRQTGASAGISPTDASFSNGEDAAGKVTGCESIAIDPSGRWIAVNSLFDSKVNLYNLSDGKYVIDYVTTGSNGLSFPTGLAWGDDLNGDGLPDLYVASSGNDQVKVFAGPDPSIPDSSLTHAAFIANVVTDNNGAVAGLNGPESIAIADLNGNGRSELYVSSFRPRGSTLNGIPGRGTQVNRYEINPASQTAIPWPATSAAPNPAATDAAFVSFPQDTNGNFTATGAGGLVFDPLALAQGNTTVTTITPDETVQAATVQTNILSSPRNFADSRLTTPQTIDRVADREPSFSRTTATSQLLARVVFASARLYAPNTVSNDGTMAPINPSGGDQFNADGSVNSAPTHDIWSSSTQDTTPPALIPQGAGNLQMPVVAPNPNAPFFAPRTAEAGLKPNSPAGTFAEDGGLRFAVVLRDAESGLFERNAALTDTGVTARTSISASFFNADSALFRGYGVDAGNPPVVHQNDEKVLVRVADERRPAPVSIGGQTRFALNVFDDGPASAGGHEQQASAVAGDGNFYCEGFLPTPPTAGDYYIDVATQDRRGNSLLYDRVWGFSTRPFIRANNDLFVSDYAGGQDFPNLIASGGDDRRFSNQPPVESYFLTNPGGQAIDDKGNIIAISVPQSFQNVDIWRILSRGPVPQDVFNAYRPTVTTQIDPNSADKTKLTRKVAVARSAVIWGAPYAGTTFVGPGTIIDPTTQERIRSFLGDGGRFFLSGRDVAFALTSNGSTTNSFLQNQLNAGFAGEADPGNNNQIQAGPGEFLNGGGLPSFDFSRPFDAKYANHRFPYQLPFPVDDGDWADGAVNLDQRLHNAFSFDFLNPAPVAGANLTTAYTYNGSVIGQRVEQTQSNGLKSRLVFFSFGFESINRRYRQPTIPDPRIPVDSRYRVANFILSYFKTGSVSGTVINNATNKPIPGFLLLIQGGGDTFAARTDANGNYSLTGLPFGGYSVTPFLNGGKTDPPGFFGGTTTGFFINLSGPDSKNINLRPIPTQPGAIIGKATASNGTPMNLLDDFPIANIPVLVRSIDKLSTTDPAGFFARLTTTDAGGNFQVAQVPSGVPIQVIFNPNNSDPAKGDNQDVPASSNLNFQGHNNNFGRRVVPDVKRPNEILVPSNNTYFLNDVANDTSADEKIPILVPVGPTISGVVSVNGTPTAGAAVQLFKVNADNSTTLVTTNPIQTTGSGGRTGANGVFSFADVMAALRTPTGGGTNYQLVVTLVRDGLTLVQNVPVTLFQGEDQTQNVDFVLATLTGKVVQGSNVPVANATVTLRVADPLNPNNFVAFVPTRTARTNALGIYSLVSVPVGGYTYNPMTKVFTQNTPPNGTVRYNVFASLGGLTGSSGAFAVRATDQNVTVPTIQLINQQLTGLIQLQVDANTPIANLGGATVELLDQSGSSVLQTMLSNPDGSYAFSGVSTGTYVIRATYKGDSVTSAPFTATSGASTGPNLLIRLRTVYGTVYDVRSKDSTGNFTRVVGATLTLSQGTTVVATTTSTAGGSFQFPAVAPGSGYVITATKSPLSGTVQVPTLTRTASPAVGLGVYLSVKTTVVSNPTTFVVGRTYTFSTPYATSTNATTRNIFDRTRGDATVSMADTFNYGPTEFDSTGKQVQLYIVSRFNPNTLAYEGIPDNGNLIRGEGYLLKVLAKPASGETLHLETPATNPNLKALSVGSASTTQRFLISLVYNSSLTSNGLNGRNLIGFPFDPSQFNSNPWDNTNTATTSSMAAVEVQFGTQRLTIKQAVAAGIIYPSITTTDGTTGRSVTSNSIVAFGGYFVQARKPGVKLLLQAPQPNP